MQIASFLSLCTLLLGFGGILDPLIKLEGLKLRYLLFPFLLHLLFRELPLYLSPQLRFPSSLFLLPLFYLFCIWERRERLLPMPLFLLFFSPLLIFVRENALFSGLLIGLSGLVLQRESLLLRLFSLSLMPLFSECLYVLSELLQERFTGLHGGAWLMDAQILGLCLTLFLFALEKVLRKSRKRI